LYRDVWLIAGIRHLRSTVRDSASVSAKRSLMGTWGASEIAASSDMMRLPRTRQAAGAIGDRDVGSADVGIVCEVVGRSCRPTLVTIRAGTAGTAFRHSLPRLLFHGRSVSCVPSCPEDELPRASTRREKLLHQPLQEAVSAIELKITLMVVSANAVASGEVELDVKNDKTRKQ
ncbi:hypothetical protein KCU61_g557, partial [Aureobasidium melanogenum]